VKPFPRPSMRRVVIVVPSLFTLFNLFFGIWSMVLASRGEFYRAGWYIFFAASSTRSMAGWRGCRAPARGSALSSTVWWTW